MNYYGDHNIAPALIRRPIITDTVSINKRVHFQQIADVLQIPIDEIRLLNPQYRMDVIPGNIHPYTLILPSKQIYAYVLSEDSIVKHNADLYTPRAVVKPSDGSTVVTSVDGDYIITEKVISHKVKRGETLKSIASHYGVTLAALRNANNGIRKVKKGQVINVVTRQRTRRPVEGTDNNTLTDNSVAADSVAVNNEEAALNEETEPEEKPVERVQPKPEPKKERATKKQETKKTEKKKTEQPVTYTVVKGDNLGKIARKHGTTVAKLKQLNGLRSDNIQIGQKLRVK